jgi:3'-5' exoribonuclease
MARDQYSGNGTIPNNDERRLIDLQPGDHFENAVFALAGKALRTAKSGRTYLVLKLRDCTGEKDGKWFSPPPEASVALDGARLVRVTGRVDANRSVYHGDLIIEACESAPTPPDLTPFLPALPADHAAHRARFFDVVRSVRQSQFKALLKKIFDPKGELWPRFEVAPAARALHHAHRGGLLEHTGEVAVLCDRAASTLPHLDRDLLVTAALLHDIGKLEEMESELRAGEYTPAGHLVGHVVLGTCSVACAADTIPEFPSHLKHELMHLILSHHGRLEHGAARHPMCAEAIVLSLCDLMSAKIAQCRDKLEIGDGDDFPSKVFGWESDRMYLGAMRRVLENTTNEDEGTGF